MTAIDLIHSISYTLVKLPRESQNLSGFQLTADSLLELFDAKAECPGWKWSPAAEPSVGALNDAEKSAPPQVVSKAPGPPPANPQLFVACTKAACEKVSAGEPTLTKYDTILGDGDCGETFQNGAEGVLKKIKSGQFSDSDVSAALVAVSEVVEMEMGGTSGGLFRYGNTNMVKVRELTNHAASSSMPGLQHATALEAIARLLSLLRHMQRHLRLLCSSNVCSMRTCH